MNQLLNDLPPTQFANGPRSYHFENSQLLYKILKGDTKLVRSLFEANGLSYTESHEWNVLWSSSSCKAFLYEGMNEH
jgi:tRNA(His) 5'-end guanylyltransferase